MDFSLGLIEVSALGNAIFVLDAMTKAADVEFVATERKLGGRLVTLVVRGKVSAVQAAIDAGKAEAMRFDCLKAAEVIARPHPEIFKFLHLDEKQEEEPKAQPVKKSAIAAEPAKPEKAAAQKSAAAVGSKKQTTESKPKKASDKKAPSKSGAKKTK